MENESYRDFSNLVKDTPLTKWDDLELSTGLSGFCALSTTTSHSFPKAIPHYFIIKSFINVECLG